MLRLGLTFFDPFDHASLGVESRFFPSLKTICAPVHRMGIVGPWTLAGSASPQHDRQVGPVSGSQSDRREARTPDGAKTPVSHCADRPCTQDPPSLPPSIKQRKRLLVLVLCPPPPPSDASPLEFVGFPLASGGGGDVGDRWRASRYAHRPSADAPTPHFRSSVSSFSTPPSSAFSP